METKIKSLKNELVELQRKTAELKEQLKTVIKQVMENSFASIADSESKNNPHNIKKTGKGSFVVNFSDFIGKPWTSTYFDYEAALPYLVEYLERKDVSEWCNELQKLLDESKDGVVKIPKTSIDMHGRKHTNYTILDAEFIRRIIEQIENAL